MSRFLRVQIYNSDASAVEYDNKLDDFWGISTGTASIDKMIMQNEVQYGEAYSSMLQIQIFGIDDDISNRKIRVIIEETLEDDNTYIITDEGERIITHASDRLIYDSGVNYESQYLFTGFIDSAKKDRVGTFRDITAYDIFYWNRDTNVVDFWNNFWEEHTTTTFKQLKEALYNYMEIDYKLEGIRFDDFEFDNPTENQEATVLKFGDLMRNIYQVQGACPHIDGEGYLVEYYLNDSRIRDLRGKLEGDNSRWEDFTTEQITGIAIYSVSNSLEQLYGTEDNCYNIVGNIFLLDFSAEQVNTICEGLMSNLSMIKYIPGEYKLKLPSPDLQLGDLLITDYGFAYVFGISLTDSLLVNELIKCSTSSATLNKDLTNLNDVEFMGSKYSEVVKTVDGLNVKFGDLSEQVESEFEQQASQIVMKVDSNGNIVQVELGKDPDDEGATRFQVSADNVSFITNGVFDITANELEINSTNFNVDKDGKLTSVSGEIGGWTISNSSLSGTTTTTELEGLVTATYTSTLKPKSLELSGTTTSTSTQEHLNSHSNIGIGQFDQYLGVRCSLTDDYTESTVQSTLYGSGLDVANTTGDIRYSGGVSSSTITVTKNNLSTNAFSSSVMTADYISTKRVIGRVTENNYRATNANLTATGVSGISHFVATGSMTSNKPYSADGHIIHCAWDNTGGYDSQIFLQNGQNPAFGIRGMSAGTWGAWKSVAVFTSQNTVSGRVVTTSGTTGGLAYQGAYGRTTDTSITNYVMTCSRNGSSPNYIGIMEIGSHMDFHNTWNNSSDYTFRLTNSSNGSLTASGTITQNSSYKIKKNIEDMQLEEALKILDFRCVKFDYIEGSEDERGFIAEEVAEILPNLVTPESGDENDHKMFSPASLNYIGIIPYLVKVVQYQNEQIKELKELVNVS